MGESTSDPAFARRGVDVPHKGDLAPDTPITLGKTSFNNKEGKRED